MESENVCFFHIEKNKYLKIWYFVACCFLSWFSNTSTILVTHHRYEIMQDKTKIKVVSFYIITELMVLNIHCNKNKPNLIYTPRKLLWKRILPNVTPIIRILDKKIRKRQICGYYPTGFYFPPLLLLIVCTKLFTITYKR